MRRRLALVVVLAALGAAPAADAAGGIEIVVDDTVKAFTAEQLLEGDVQGRTYTVDGLPQLVTGLSLVEALRSSGIDPGASSVTVRGAGGRRLQVLEDELADPPPFPEGPVVTWVDGNVTKLLVPAGGKRAPRVIASSPDEPLRLEPGVTDGLEVAVTSPGTSVEAEVGETLYFDAFATGSGFGESLRWLWDFRDGTRSTRSGVAHAFGAPGVYRVVVTAASGDLSGTATVVVTVADDEPKAKPEPEPEREPKGSGGATSGTGSTPTVAPATTSSPSSTPAASPSEPEPNPRRKRERETPDPEPSPPAPELETVEGVVLSPGAAAPVPAATAQAAGLTPQEHAGDDGDGPGVPWVSLAIVLAFLSGLQAARVQRSRWAPRRR